MLNKCYSTEAEPECIKLMPFQNAKRNLYRTRGSEASLCIININTNLYFGLKTKSGALNKEPICIH